MEHQFPRILLAGTGSGCGKTTLTCAILQALVNRGLQVAGFKCGPDYIDPMFHSHITGSPCRNLDPFFLDGNTQRYLLGRQAGADLAVIEGVMGYYDGLAMTSRCSTYSVSRATGTPAVLVVPARGAALSILAVIDGFLRFTEDNTISGVIFNRCSPMLYPALAKAVEDRFGGRVRPLGYLPAVPEATVESRHLGLITAQEIRNLDDKLQALARQAEKSLDLDGLLALARSAPALSYTPVTLPRQETPVKIAVARDKAFCFYYRDNLDLLEELGATLLPFSPLTDPALPEGADGLYLGGGYPELYSRELAENRSMLASVRAALESNLPCIAECGGFMYLCRDIGDAPAAGFLPGSCFDRGKLTRFGYITLTARQDNLLCRAGEHFPAHEFHHWDATDTGAGFRAEKPSSTGWDCAFTGPTLYAGFPHFHFYAKPDLALNFYRACLRKKEQYGNHKTTGY